jgi:uncharacterized membrane protein YjgN (DUF898 family)
MTLDVAREGTFQSDGGTPLDYDGTMGAVAGITFINAVLTFATLGIYRFWGKTRLRRYLWSRIDVFGDRLEYSGTGLELFLGFLVAMVLLLPIFGIPVLVQVAYPLDFEAQGVAEAVFTLIILFLIQVAIFRARRYRLTRTRWRGIRGGQSGSAFIYALRAMGLFILTGLSLGLFWPWASVALQRYKIGNTWLGDRQLSFHGSGLALLKYWLVVLVLGVAGIVLFTIFIGISMGAGNTRGDPMNWAGANVMVVAAYASFFGAAIAWVWYKVREFRYFVESTHLGTTRFSSSLSTLRVALIYLLFALVAGLVIGLLFVAASAGLGVAIMEAMQSTQGQTPDESIANMWGYIGENPFLLLGLIAALVVISVVWGVVRAAFLMHLMLKAVIRSLSVWGGQEIAELAQSRQAMPGRGEGMADALDVGGFDF